MPHSAFQAYGMTRRLAPTARQAEAKALMDVARKLDQAAQDPARTRLIIRALDANAKLWRTLRAGAINRNWEIGEDVQAAVTSLSLFVERSTQAALANALSARLDPLIQINRQVARGLMGITPQT